MAKEVSFLIKIHSDGGAKRVTADAEEMRRALREVQDDADRAKRSVLTWSEAAQAVDVLQRSIGELQAVLTEMTADYQTSVVAQTQLATIMRQRMGSTEEEIQSIRDLCSAQQELGVVEDDIAASGAQQMATFLKQKQSLEVLIPAMNNLIAQQDGLNATVQGAVSIGNMMGKAMQGQTEVLQRVGITFDETQKQVLQYGDETERAAMLAEVITANVGHMNEELGKTDAGKQKQMENTLGDLKEQLGSLVQGAMPFVTIAAETTICVAGLVKLVTATKALGAAFALTSLKALALAAHEKVVAVAQNLLSASGYTAAAGTAALTVAVTALYAAATLGLSLVITGLVALFSSMGDEAEEASQEVDMLKESTDAFGNASANAKAEIDMETSSLAALINGHQSTAKKVEELNRKYGESFGYHRTAAEWYDTLISKSKVYCAQMGYEAQAKVLSSQIAAKQLEKEARQGEQRQLGQKSLDSSGRTHYNWENAAGGKDYYEQLGGEVNRLTGEITTLQRQYDSCIRHMVEAQKELDRSRSSTRITGNNIREATTDEIKQELEQKQKDLDRVKGGNAAERQRLNREIGRLQKELNRRDGVNKAEQGTETVAKKTAGKKTAPEKPVANARTLEDAGKNITYYENRLKKTDRADKNKIASLTALIGKYKELQKTIEAEMAAASRPASLDTLEDIDAELQRQQQLRKQASKENLGQIDAEIRRLNSLRTAFEDSSHAALKTDEIKTYDQLDSEIAFYERQLKTATETERTEIEKQILVLQKLRGEWDETLASISKPADIGELDSMEELDKAISYYGERQRKASGDEVENIQRTINALQAKRDALARMTELPAMQEELAGLDGLTGKPLRMELELTGLDGIREKVRKLQAMLADTKNPLGKEQRAEVQGLVDGWTRYEKKLSGSTEKMSAATDSVQQLGSSLSGLGDAIGVPELNIAGTLAQAIATMTAGYATATAQASSMGPWAWVAFAAAGLAQLSAMISSVKGLNKFADGGIAYGPTLGIFGEYAGASHNPEVVAPLDRLKSLMGDAGAAPGTLELKVKGRDLVGVLANETRINRRKTNIKL